MKINDLEINTDIYTILDQLRSYLRETDLDYLKKTPRRSSGYAIIQCPYHKDGQENHPSAQLREEDGLFYCFNCKEAHSFADFVGYCIDGDGKEWLKEHFDVSEIQNRELKLSVKEKKERKKPHYISSELYQKYRRTHPYMFERKLNMDIIRKYDIGYDEDFVINKLQDNGEVKQYHFGECITFPNKDINGNILFIARRCINNKTFHYPPNVDKPVYGLFEIYRDYRHGKKISDVYVCESMLDALYICTMGKYAVALNGLGTDKQYETLENVGFITTYILATDNDKGGRDARYKFKKNVKHKFIRELDYKSYGDCKDINDMTKEQFLNAHITDILHK